MYCIKCGASIDSEAVFCTNCGNKIENHVKQEKKQKKKYYIWIILVLGIGIAILMMLGKGNIKNVETMDVEKQVVIKEEIAENDVKVEENGIKEGMMQEIRNYLMKKSDEYGQMNSNYARISVEPVIIEGHLEKKDKSKDPTMEDDDEEYFYITLDEPINIAYESYLDECVVEEYMDTVKLDAVNLDLLCGKKVYCCGKVIDPGVASSGIHMMTAIVIETGNEKSVLKDANREGNLNFISDCSEKNYNKVGNTMANILEGGYVTTQGDWMYYVLPQYGKWGLSDGRYGIYKEPIQGGSAQLIYVSQEEDMEIKYLNVIGDYIFFQERTLKSIRTDGKELKDYGFYSKYGFYIMNEYIWYVKESVLSATESEWFLTSYNMKTQEEEEGAMIDPNFWGIEDTGESFVVYYGQDFSNTAIEIEGKRRYYEIEFWESNYNMESVDNGLVSFDHIIEPHKYYKPLKKYLVNPMHIYNMPNQVIVVQKEAYNNKNFYFDNSDINFIGDYIVGYGVVPGEYKGLSFCTIEEYMNDEYHYVNGDEAWKIFTAGDWIYYNCNNGIHRVRLDGSGYQEMKWFIE